MPWDFQVIFFFKSLYLTLEIEFEHGLPKISEDLSKPFARKLPEFYLSKYLFCASCLTIVVTFFPFLKIDVYYPILVIYVLFLLAVFTLKHWKIYSMYMRCMK